MARTFIEDLTRAASKSADFIRDKNSSLKYAGLNADLYASEDEFIAEIYRLMVRRNKKYKQSLLINYHKPMRNDREFVSAHPDIAYYPQEGEKTAIEVKGIWFLTEEAGLYQSDIKRIMDDYDKLHVDWKNFGRKTLIVGFLGDRNKFRKNKFSDAVEALTQGDSDIYVVSC